MLCLRFGSGMKRSDERKRIGYYRKFIAKPQRPQYSAQAKKKQKNVYLNALFLSVLC